MTFHVGQKVVCVDASPSVEGFVSDLARYEVYTVRQLVFCSKTGVPGVLLDEIAPYPSKAGFRVNRFRPVVHRKTDISLFVRIAEEASRTGKVLA